eukprot:COSAG05_NODE_487_length_9342_cov_4.078979_6_plen_198_part_00
MTAAVAQLQCVCARIQSHASCAQEMNPTSAARDVTSSANSSSSPLFLVGWLVGWLGRIEIVVKSQSCMVSERYCAAWCRWRRPNPTPALLPLTRRGRVPAQNAASAMRRCARQPPMAMPLLRLLMRCVKLDLVWTERRNCRCISVMHVLCLNDCAATSHRARAETVARSSRRTSWMGCLGAGTQRRREAKSCGRVAI